MKMLFLRAAVAALALGYAPVASANGLVIEGNGARAHGEWGGELGAGYNLSMGGITLRPIAGAFFYAGDNDRYYKDELGNGQTRCRDSSNGQFADNDKCNNTKVKPYAKLELTYTIPLVAEIGAGARFSSDKVRPYGTASFALAPKLRLKGNAGPKYFALGLRLDF